MIWPHILNIFCLIALFVGLLIALSAIASFGWFILGSGFLSIVIFANLIVAFMCFYGTLVA